MLQTEVKYDELITNSVARYVFVNEVGSIAIQQSKQEDWQVPGWYLTQDTVLNNASSLLALENLAKHGRLAINIIKIYMVAQGAEYKPVSNLMRLICAYIEEGKDEQNRN